MTGSLFSLALRGDLTNYMRADARAVTKIHNYTVRRAGGRTKRGIQAQIRKAFSGNAKGSAARFVNTIKMKSDPASGLTFPARVKVYSKARYAAKQYRTEDIDLLEVFSRSETVTAANGAWLAIPTKDAPLRGGRGAGGVHATPRESGLKLVFLHTADPNKAVLVTRAVAGSRPVVMYVLLKQTVRAARLDPDAVNEASLAKVPGDFAASWAREDAALQAQYGRGVEV